jgi:hypothetical protein
MEQFLALPRYSFTPAAIKNAPEHPGVYGIFLGRELVYIGYTNGPLDTIRACLARHFDGLHGDCTMDATRYVWEASASPHARLLNLLRQFGERHQRAPRCNEKPTS